MTWADRVEAFQQAFSQWPASWLHLVKEQDRDVAYGTWLLGNDYRNKTRYYGAYPPGYLARVMALFPDVIEDNPTSILHIFSGSLPPGNYTRCDLVQDAEIHGSVYDLPSLAMVRPSLVIADPPYSAEDAKRYSTPMVNRGRVLQSIAAITDPGKHLVWLDTVWPMHSKTQWITVARIAIVRSTNHRVRMTTIFQRV